MTNLIVNCSNFEIANNRPFTLIAGPCQLESQDHAINISTKLKEITSELGINLIYKTLEFLRNIKIKNVILQLLLLQKWAT